MLPSPTNPDPDASKIAEKAERTKAVVLKAIAMKDQLCGMVSIVHPIIQDESLLLEGPEVSDYEATHRATLLAAIEFEQRLLWTIQAAGPLACALGLLAKKTEVK